MKKIKVLLTLLVSVIVFGANAFAAPIYGTGYIGFEGETIEYTGSTATINVKFNTEITTHIEQYSCVGLKLGTGLSINEEATLALTQPAGGYYADGYWNTDDTFALTSDTLCSFVVDIVDPNGDLSVSFDIDGTFVMDESANIYPVDENVKATLVASAPAKDETVKAETSDAGATKITYGKDYTGSKALNGKYLVKANLGSAVLDKYTTFTVTYDNTTKPFGASMWEDLGIEIDGTLDANKIIVAVAFDFDVNPADVTIAIAE